MTENNADSLAEYFANIITSKHNQHAIVRVVGAAGTGKSWGTVDLATETAKIIAEIVGGKPQDYYSFERNLAVINKEDIKRVMTNPGKYNILHLDDIGVGWNARKYKDDFNIFLNDVIQTFRPQNNLVLMTLQSGFLIDKVPRSLAHYEIEMESANFDEGITIAKVNKVSMQHKLGKLYYPYIRINGTRYVRHIFEKPDSKLMEEYERIRAIQLKKLSDMKDEEEEQMSNKLTLKQRFGVEGMIGLYNKLGSWVEVAVVVSTIVGKKVSAEACRKVTI